MYCETKDLRVGDRIRHVGVINRINDKSFQYVDRYGLCHDVGHPGSSDVNLWWISRPSVILDLVRVVHS